MVQCGISGAVELSNLPKSLKTLDFRNNLISQVAVGFLPDDFLDARFFHYHVSIRITFVPITGRKTDPRVRIKERAYNSS